MKVIQMEEVGEADSGTASRVPEAVVEEIEVEININS